MTTKETPDLYVEMTNLLTHSVRELEKLYRSYVGKVTDIDSGTHIEIHTDAGSVRLYNYLNNTDNCATIYCKLTKTYWDEQTKPILETKLGLHDKL